MTRDIFIETWRSDRSNGPRYRLVWGTRTVPVRSLWDKGLSIDAETPFKVPGLVDLFRGDEHVASVLLCSDAIEAGEHRFHFKRMTHFSDGPARDYAPEPDPLAFLPGPDRVRPGL